jgi:glycerol-3-phosphate acyltransferase PlsX
MKLVIDVMGFENDVSQAIIACEKFYKLHDDVKFVLVGSKKVIEKCKGFSNFEIIDAEEVIKMNESPLSALRKTNSSMYKAIELVANDKADGVLSAGSTACYVALVFHLLKKIDGIDKIAFMPYVPTTAGGGFNMIDVGANKECSGKDLYNFAIMANVYCKEVMHIANPRIGVINIGTEDDKGFVYHQQAHNLLKSNKNINYVGFVEPRNLLNGVVDIAVSDGYTGNITLKSMEGGLKALKYALKQQYNKP